MAEARALSDVPRWIPNRRYFRAERVLGRDGRVWEVTVAGKAGTGEPNWPTPTSDAPSPTRSDGGVTWTHIGKAGSEPATAVDSATAGGGGGGGSDPLALVHYLSVGASPAASGAVRLEEGADISALASDNSGTSGMAAGDQPLIALELVNDGGGNFWDVLRIGGDGPLGAEIIFDPFTTGVLYHYADHIVGMGDFDPATGYGIDAAFRAVVSVIGFIVRDGANTVLFRATTDGIVNGVLNVVMKGLPTTDPHTVGALWSNSGVIMRSAG